jgi:hypothetical protein
MHEINVLWAPTPVPIFLSFHAGRSLSCSVLATGIFISRFSCPIFTLPRVSYVTGQIRLHPFSAGEESLSCVWVRPTGTRFPCSFMKFLLPRSHSCYSTLEILLPLVRSRRAPSLPLSRVMFPTARRRVISFRFRPPSVSDLVLPCAWQIWRLGVCFAAQIFPFLFISPANILFLSDFIDLRPDWIFGVSTHAVIHSSPVWSPVASFCSAWICFDFDCCSTFLFFAVVLTLVLWLELTSTEDCFPCPVQATPIRFCIQPIFLSTTILPGSRFWVLILISASMCWVLLSCTGKCSMKCMWGGESCTEELFLDSWPRLQVYFCWLVGGSVGRGFVCTDSCFRCESFLLTRFQWSIAFL